MALRYPKADFVGLELSEETCNICREAVSRMGLADSVRLFSGRLAQLHRKFDLIYSFCVLEHVGNPAEEVSQVISHLKPKGTAVLVYPSKGYCWLWSLTTYLCMVLTGRRPRPHTVDVAHMKAALSGAPSVVQEGYYGFRPPQPMFKLFPLRLMKRLVPLFTRVEAIFQAMAPSTLYLRYHIIQGSAAPKNQVSSIAEDTVYPDRMAWVRLLGLTVLMLITYWIYNPFRALGMKLESSKSREE